MWLRISYGESIIYNFKNKSIIYNFKNKNNNLTPSISVVLFYTNHSLFLIGILLLMYKFKYNQVRYYFICLTAYFINI